MNLEVTGLVSAGMRNIQGELVPREEKVSVTFSGGAPPVSCVLRTWGEGPQGNWKVVEESKERVAGRRGGSGMPGVQRGHTASEVPRGSERKLAGKGLGVKRDEAVEVLSVAAFPEGQREAL